MNRQGRILVVDDLEKWRDQLVETLQYAGYLVDSKGRVTQVLEQLEDSFYHLLLLDVRLVDTDSNNEGGIDLLDELNKSGLGAAMKVIVLSAYSTQERMYLTFKDHKVIDFLSKDKFSQQVLLDSVQLAFSKKMNINLSLDIVWQGVSKTEWEIRVNEVNGKQFLCNKPSQRQVSLELDDLLCRLFSQFETVLVRPLSLNLDNSGVLWVQPFSMGRSCEEMVVKFGYNSRIEEENANFMRWVLPFAGTKHSTMILDQQCTPHLGGTKYLLLGAENSQVEDFGSFYRHASVPQIKRVLDRLFLDTCSAWYANVVQLPSYNLTAYYQQILGFTPEELENSLVRLQQFVVQSRQKLYFKSLSSVRSYTNPLLNMDWQPFIRPTCNCTTHGNFNQHNLLLDATNNTWLIDFQATGQGHIFRDVVRLESEIRYCLLETEEATLDERLQMEEILCSIERFSQVSQLESSFSTKNAALAKAFEIVVHLRTLAHRLVVLNASDDISEYYIALFYNAVNSIRFCSLSLRQREHALLSASMLRDWLTLRG